MFESSFLMLLLLLISVNILIHIDIVFVLSCNRINDAIYISEIICQIDFINQFVYFINQFVSMKLLIEIIVNNYLSFLKAKNYYAEKLFKIFIINTKNYFS